VSSDIQPEIITIWQEAKSYIDQGDYDQAIEIYKYILVRYGDNSAATEHANAFLGDIYLTLGRLDLAESCINKAVARNPDNPGYHYLLGFAYSKRSEWEKAVREFEVSVKKKPDEAEYIRGLGWAVFNRGDKLQGLKYLKQAFALSPANANILLDLANAFLMNLDFNMARDCAKHALRLNPENALAKEVFENIIRFQRDHAGNE
jgi:tetratricopeptide (TPR) repeat protein